MLVPIYKRPCDNKFAVESFFRIISAVVSDISDDADVVAAASAWCCCEFARYVSCGLGFMLIYDGSL